MPVPVTWQKCGMPKQRLFNRGERKMKTINQRLDEIINSQVDFESDSIEKLIQMAYYRGRETAAKEVCDEAAKVFAEQHEKAEKCRYRHMAAKVVGTQKIIYHGDYDGGMTSMFGRDITKF